MAKNQSKITYLIHFGAYLVKLPPVFLWNVAETHKTVKTPCAPMILRSIYTYNERKGCCGVYNNQKTAKKRQFVAKKSVFWIKTRRSHLQI